MSEADNTPKKSYFRVWYDKHKDTYNQKRKSRYHQDPNYREQQVENSRSQRARASEGRKKDIRYTIGVAAEMVGRDAQTLRSWCKRGHIPDMSDGHTHRVFTPHQVELMKELAAYMETWTPSKANEFKTGLAALVASIKERW